MFKNSPKLVVLFCLLVSAPGKSVSIEKATAKMIVENAGGIALCSGLILEVGDRTPIDQLMLTTASCAESAWLHLETVGTGNPTPGEPNVVSFHPGLDLALIKLPDNEDDTAPWTSEDNLSGKNSLAKPPEFNLRETPGGSINLFGIGRNKLGLAIKNGEMHVGLSTIMFPRRAYYKHPRAQIEWFSLADPWLKSRGRKFYDGKSESYADKIDELVGRSRKRSKIDSSVNSPYHYWAIQILKRYNYKLKTQVINAMVPQFKTEAQLRALQLGARFGVADAYHLLKAAGLIVNLDLYNRLSNDFYMTLIGEPGRGLWTSTFLESALFAHNSILSQNVTLEEFFAKQCTVRRLMQRGN